MKLIITGSTGFVGTEVVRQALQRADITSVIALSRSPILSQPGIDIAHSKLKNVLIKDYEVYSDDVKKHFEGAGGCIWTVGITPGKIRSMPFSEVTRVCQTCPLTALETMRGSGVQKPFRFLRMSGHAAERDQSKKLWVMGEFGLMLGEAETRLLNMAKESSRELEVCIAKPGIITARTFGRRSISGFALRWIVGVPTLGVQECAAAMIDQVVKGYEKDTMMTEDLVRIGSRVVAAEEGAVK